MRKKDAQKTKKPWPTRAAMAQVYEKKLWGKGETSFYSGEGSHLSQLVKPYIHALSTFLISFKPPLTVCDLGCGDFNIGKQLAPFTQKYTAVDIVPELIAYNKETFTLSAVCFSCLDISVDTLPQADCVIIRQVLQHLSNAEILSICKKLYPYNYVIVTEHLPQGDFIPNLDIISGQGIRLKKGSGVNLLAPPFNLKVQAEKQVVSISLGANKGTIVTTLYRMR